MSTRRSATYDDLRAVPDDGYLYELVRGEIRRLPPSKGNQGRTEWILGAAIERFLEDRAQALGLPQDAHIEDRDLLVGRVLCGDAAMRFHLHDDPDQVRAADVAYLTPDQVARCASLAPDSPVPEVPALVATVIDETEAPSLVRERVGDYLAGGARLVWVIDRRTRTARIYRPGWQPSMVDADGVLDGGPVVRGFRVPLPQIFPACG